MRLHPATLLGSWLAFVLVLPWLAPPSLAWAAAASASVLVWPAARRQGWQLLRRTRLLLLALLLVHGFTEPGTPLVAGWPAPTWEGVEQGLIQSVRLLSILATLAGLLAHLGDEGLLVALYTLLRPLGALGLPVDRFTVRLALVLGFSREGRRPEVSFAGLLTAWDRPPPAREGPLILELPAMGWADGVAVLAVAVLLGGLLA